MKRPFFIFPCAILVSLFALALQACSNSDSPEIVIIHTNDTHSQIDGMYLDEKPVGGVVERAAFIELMREQDPELIYLDAGDMVQGSPYFNIWNGMVEMKAMSMQKLICSTFGNHEFDNGIDFLTNMLNYASFPIINCNYDVKGTPLEPYTQTSIVFEQKGVRIGITGVTCDPHNLIFDRNWEGITYINPVVAANKEAAILRAKGCDLVVLLSHVGYFSNDTVGDRWIAAQSKDIDLIIGGHTHTNLEQGEVVKNLNGKPVYITQTGGKTAPIGFIKAQFKPNGKHKDGSQAYKLQSIECQKLHPDTYDLSEYGRDMSEFISSYHDSLDDKMSSVLAFASHDLPRFRPESPLGNLVSDILREVGEEQCGKKMDVGIMNVGGLRNDLSAGDVKIGDLYSIFPFENTLAVLEIEGRYIEETIHNIESKRLEALSGMNITLNIHRDTLQNGDIREVVNASNILIDGKPIDPDKIYYVATIDYLAEGNDRMTALKHAKKYTNTGILLRDLMIDYFKKKGLEGKRIDATIDHRITVIEQK